MPGGSKPGNVLHQGRGPSGGSRGDGAGAITAGPGDAPQAICLGGENRAMTTYTQEQMQAVVDEIEKQTDRGAAIVAATVIDNVLEHLITSRLIGLSSERREALFDNPNAPLGDLYAKIELAFALGLFNEERRKSLHLIRKVRNEFAHRMDTVSFDHPEIAKMIEGKVPPKVREYAMSTRTKFLFTANILFIYLSFAAGFPQMRISTVDNEPSFHQYFDAVNSTVMQILLERHLDEFKSRKPSSEQMKLSLANLPEIQRKIMEDHLRRISEPFSDPDDTNYARVYNDGIFELCKNQSGEYLLLPVPSERNV
jgi:hypothetical protein